MDSTAELKAKIGVLLSNNTEVILMVLHQLPLVDLLHLQRVCKLWHILAAKVLASRHQLQFFSSSDRDGLRTAQLMAKQEKRNFYNWKKCWQSKPSLCLRFQKCDSQQGITPKGRVHLQSHLPQTCRFVDVLCCEGFIATNEIFPNFLNRNLSFCRTLHCPNRKQVSNHRKGTEDGVLAEECCAEPEESSPPCKIKKTGVSRRERLPRAAKSCCFLNLNASSASTSAGREQSSSLEVGGNEANLVEMAGKRCNLCNQVLKANVGPLSVCINQQRRGYSTPKFDGMAILCLPELPNVTYCPISISHSERPFDAAHYRTWGGCIPDTARPKAILVFNDSNSCPQRYIQGSVIRAEGRVAVAGGQLNAEHSSDGRTNLGLVGVAVCGDGVAAASIVLTPDIVSDPDVIEAFLQFQTFYDDTKRSIAFFITCVGRQGESIKESVGWETEIFRLLYPATPVFATFVYGEYCHKFIPYNRNSKKWDLQEMRLKQTVDSMRLQFRNIYSTVVLFLQFG